MSVPHEDPVGVDVSGVHPTFLDTLDDEPVPVPPTAPPTAVAPDPEVAVEPAAVPVGPAAAPPAEPAAVPVEPAAVPVGPGAAPPAESPAVNPEPAPEPTAAPAVAPSVAPAMAPDPAVAPPAVAGTQPLLPLLPESEAEVFGGPVAPVAPPIVSPQVTRTLVQAEMGASFLIQQCTLFLNHLKLVKDEQAEPLTIDHHGLGFLVV